MIFSDQAKAIKPTSQLADSSDIAGFIPGPDCNCPSDCKETIYSQEMSQAKLRPKNRFITRLEREGQFLYNLTEQINNQTCDHSDKAFGQISEADLANWNLNDGFYETIKQADR